MITSWMSYIFVFVGVQDYSIKYLNERLWHLCNPSLSFFSQALCSTLKYVEWLHYVTILRFFKRRNIYTSRRDLNLHTVMLIYNLVCNILGIILPTSQPKVFSLQKRVALIVTDNIRCNTSGKLKQRPIKKKFKEFTRKKIFLALRASVCYLSSFWL